MPGISINADDEAAMEGAAATVAFLLSLRAKGFRDIALLRAMESVPRQLFAPPRCADLARSDVSLPLPCGQTMLAPATIATLLMAARIGPGQRILEIGTGSGYVTALLARLGGGEVVSVERFRTLAIAAAERLELAGVTQAAVIHADGLAPIPGLGMFDRIILTGTVEAIPRHLADHLRPQGQLIAVVRDRDEARLRMLTKSEDGEGEERLGAVLRLPPLARGFAQTL